MLKKPSLIDFAAHAWRVKRDGSMQAESTWVLVMFRVAVHFLTAWHDWPVHVPLHWVLISFS